MNTVATQESEKTNIRAKCESAIEKTKEACERLQAKTAAAAKTADTAVRTHPYQAIGIAFGVGLLVGVLAIRKRRE
jgi:ElaB/YqjD/DUF883 family membrane-anchored ribosome-binding protein